MQQSSRRPGTAGRGQSAPFTTVPRALAATRPCACVKSHSITRRESIVAVGDRLVPHPRRSGVLRATAGKLQQTPQRAVDGIVIVDHGSRAKASNDMLLEFVDLYRSTTGQPIVEPAHMELADPSIADAVARCVEQGATRVVIAPYFLSRGRHVQQDIPTLVKDAEAAHPGIECVVADPIGIDPLMVRLISNRVASASAGAHAAAAGGNGVSSSAGATLQGSGLVVALAAAAAAGAAAAAAALAPAGVAGLG